jgi:hypothetical protein
MAKKASMKKAESGNISIGGNVGPGTAVGYGASIKSDNIAGRDIIVGTSVKDITAALAQLYMAIEAKSFPSETAAQEVREAVEIIEAENEKGQEANEKVVRMSFRTLAQMAPDIWEVAIATFTNPMLGISTVVKKIAERAKLEASGRDKTE